ncbi:MAG TPA: cytochrome b N-terminal domain-containing protein [Holophagaceae bacterium]|nr:cytochrome b N-terminal domain-containing protein [Holophagaceae bacterium]
MAELAMTPKPGIFARTASFFRNLVPKRGALGHWYHGILDAPASLWGWLQDRWEKMDLFDETHVEKAKTNPWYALGGMWYWVWMLVIGSGVLLMIFYIPDTNQAFGSIERIMQNWKFGAFPIGSIVRGLHKYGADAFIILATMRVYRIWFTGGYKGGHELSFMVALLILIIGMYSGLTGYLLIWNQRALWATKVMATFPTYLDKNPSWIPGGDFINATNQGKTTTQVLLGGTSIGPATVTRFYAFHFMLSFLAMIFFELRVYHRDFKRMNIGRWSKLIIFLIIVAIAIFLPAAQGSPANPEVTPNPILSDWYFLAMYQMLKLQDPYLATILTVGIPFIVIFALFMDRRPETKWGQRQIFNWIGIGGLIYFVLFSFLIINEIADIHRDPPLWYYSMGLFLLIGYFQDWAYVMKRDNKRWWETFHLFFVAFILVAMSANTLYHYFGDIREHNVRAKEIAQQIMVSKHMTLDQAYGWLESNRPNLNLWHTNEVVTATGKPKGMELWWLHALAWLGIAGLGFLVGMYRWGAKRDALQDAEAAKAKPKAAPAAATQA